MSDGNALAAYQYLTSRGLPGPAATGVVGNLVAESGVNPGSVQVGGPGRGIAQWSAGGRWNTFQAWAASRGLPPLSLDTQLQFLVFEMQSMGVWQQLQRTTDTTQAAAIVMRSYEMPADQSTANAVHRAQLGEQAIGGAAPAAPGSIDTVPASADSIDGCLVGIPLPGAGTVCLLSRRNGQIVLGGLLLTAGASVGIVGLLLLAAYGFKSSGAARATGQALQAAGAGVALVAPEIGVPMAAAGGRVATGAPIRGRRQPSSSSTRPTRTRPASTTDSGPAGAPKQDTGDTGDAGAAG
jgi:hypothetical protein